MNNNDKGPYSNTGSRSALLSGPFVTLLVLYIGMFDEGRVVYAIIVGGGTPWYLIRNLETKDVVPTIA